MTEKTIGMQAGEFSLLDTQSRGLEFQEEKIQNHGHQLPFLGTILIQGQINT